MTTYAGQVKSDILNLIAETLKVTKTSDNIGKDNYDTGLPVRLEDFKITFELPKKYNYGVRGFNDNMIETKIRVRTLIKNELEENSQKWKHLET